MKWWIDSFLLLSILGIATVAVAFAFCDRHDITQLIMLVAFFPTFLLRQTLVSYWRPHA